jgi:hypothetical protein
MNGVCPLYIYIINRYKRDGSSEMAVMETGFKYVIEFCNNTVEPFGSVTLKQFLEWPNSGHVINPHGSIKCGEMISGGHIRFSRRTLLHDQSKLEE